MPRIDVVVRVPFHQYVCPANHEKCKDGINCNNTIPLEYRCTRCVRECLKCSEPRLNSGLPYVRGCEEARRAINNAPICVCSEVEGCES